MYYGIYLYLLLIIFLSIGECELPEVFVYSLIHYKSIVTIHLSSQPRVKGGAIFWVILNKNQDFSPANWCMISLPKGPESKFPLTYLENLEGIQIHT